MDDYRCREYFGTIIKEEKLASLSRLNLPNTLVLEAVEPFPGYYGNNPGTEIPHIYFLATNQEYSFETVLRISKRIINSRKVYFEATIGNVEIKNRILPVLRIKALDKYFTVSELQNIFSEEGIEFSKHQKISDSGIIKLKKFFFLEELESNLFYEYDKNDKGYFILPVQLSWEEFKCLTEQVRNNWNIHGFDAAQGVIYRNWEVCDIVRIYCKKLSLDLLSNIQEKYFTEIKKIK